jgi:hypothetical protein
LLPTKDHGQEEFETGFSERLGTPAGDQRFSEEQLPTWIDGGKTPFF